MASTLRKNIFYKIRTGLNLSVLLAIFSLWFCWFYGIPPLLAGIIAFVNIIRIRKISKSKEKSIMFKLKWGYFIALSGIILSVIFTIIYAVALITGAYIR